MMCAAGDAGVSLFISGDAVMAWHEIDYVRPVNYGDPIRIELSAAEKLASKVVTVLIPYDLSVCCYVESRFRNVGFSINGVTIALSNGINWSWLA